MASYGDLQNATSSHLNNFSLLCTSYIRSGKTVITDNMPSIRTFSNLALSALSVAQTALGFSSLSSPIYRLSTDSSNGASEACPNPQLSCHNTTAVANLCCFNAPGGTLLQTQFWDTNPVSGPDNSWTIHGLWVSIICHPRIINS